MKKLCIWVMIFFTILVAGGCGKSTSIQGGMPSSGGNRELILATTTSTQDSGLLDVLLPRFEKQTGFKVKTIAVGTGQALALGEKGEADVLLVHAPASERKVVATGAAVNRKLVMHNDFVILGPSDDPAGIRGKSVLTALTNLASRQGLFLSRGDNSGTHQLEKKLWAETNINPAGIWYQEVGAGMGQTLKVANERMGYTISDRATYLAQRKNMSLQILIEGDRKLINLYHVMEVNPNMFSKVNGDGARAFSEYLLEPETQSLIAIYGKEQYGQPLFFADGGKNETSFTD